MKNTIKTIIVITTMALVTFSILKAIPSQYPLDEDKYTAYPAPDLPAYPPPLLPTSTPESKKVKGNTATSSEISSEINSSIIKIQPTEVDISLCSPICSTLEPTLGDQYLQK